MIEACEMPDCIKHEERISLEVMPGKNQKAWKRMKQKTALAHGTFSLTFAHYRTTSSDDKTNKIDTMMRNTAIKHGIIAKDWQWITDLMILKQSGLFIIDKHKKKSYVLSLRS